MQEINLLHKVRAGFVERGTSLGVFCRLNDIDRSNAIKALQGKWKGKKATEMQNRLLAASRGEE